MVILIKTKNNNKIKVKKKLINHFYQSQQEIVPGSKIQSAIYLYLMKKGEDTKFKKKNLKFKNYKWKFSHLI